MVSSIVIIGNVPPSDLALLHTAAESHAITIERKNSVEELCGAFTTVANGYFSYMSCTRDTLQELFANLPIGASEQFPFFQRIDSKEYPDALKDFPVSGVFESPLSLIPLGNMLSTVLFHTRISANYRGIVSEVIKYRNQKHELIQLSMALSKQNDLDKLLALILRESCTIMNADAGSIYIRERSQPEGTFTDKLRFKVSLNYSVDIPPTREFTIDIDTNRIAGYVAATGRPLTVKDVYNLDSSVPYKHSSDFDERFHYRMKSMLTVPLKNVEGDVVGVLQLMNKKKDQAPKLSSPEIIDQFVESFTYSDEEFLQSIGALAAVSIERAQLYENIEQIFEGFLGSSIAAIDERDRVTSGHSRRVMGYAMAFVEAINKSSEGPYAAVHFTEDRKRQFKFASLLHDIGKIGVPEALLTKESRLSKGEFAAIMGRMDLIVLQMKYGLVDYSAVWPSPDSLEEERALLGRLNAAGHISDADYANLEKLRGKKYQPVSGEEVPLLTASEWEALSVRRGNLTPEERDLVNSHALSSYRILSKIPWTPELIKIPHIAAHHHEKLDGSGYPDGLKDKDMCLEQKILTVIDIYDALVAQDRQYKPAMPPDKAIGILRDEAGHGKIDSDIVEFFIRNNIHMIFFKKVPTN